MTATRLTVQLAWATDAPNVTYCETFALPEGVTLAQFVGFCEETAERAKQLGGRDSAAASEHGYGRVTAMRFKRESPLECVYTVETDADDYDEPQSLYLEEYEVLGLVSDDYCGEDEPDFNGDGRGR